MRQRSCSPDWRENLWEWKAAFSVVGVNVTENAFSLSTITCKEVCLTRIENLTLRANVFGSIFGISSDFAQFRAKTGKKLAILVENELFLNASQIGSGCPFQPKP
jgi:hypothetical protein